MYHFCTYFDRHYLVRGLSLYYSLLEHAGTFKLYILCFDTLTYNTLKVLELNGVELISLEALERFDPELAETKCTRTLMEYYFTCTPCLQLYVLSNFQDVHVLTYLDADLFFFSSPEPLFAEMGAGSILIGRHRFSPRLRHLEVYGVHAVSMLAFRNDSNAIECLRWWRDRCIEWCYDREEKGKFADQKYLDDWPTRFPGTVVTQHKGADLAPWNISGYELSERESSIFVDNDPLIFYHFHMLRTVNPVWFDTGLRVYGVQLSSIIRRRIYAPYIRKLHSLMEQLDPSNTRALRYERPAGEIGFDELLCSGDDLPLVFRPLVAETLTLWANSYAARPDRVDP
jgi:hypothetical protein